MPPGVEARTTGKEHGRIEVRSIRVARLLTVSQEWVGAKQGFEIVRARTIKGTTTVEVVHGITSLGPEAADAERLLGLVRGHWSIENELHYVRDMTLGEDASRIRTGSAPEVMAGLRNGVIGLLAEVGAASLAAAQRTMTNCFSKALTLLGLR